MKKLITLLLILMIIPVVFAPDGESDDIDYSSPDDVNSMEPQDLASAIEQGKISDMSIVDDNKLADALSNNPSISAKLEDGDLARAVNQDLSLLDNPSVMSDFDSRAQSDTHILNDNPNIKKKWFADKGITDEGAELESYDGSIVKTKGSQATTFNVNDHPGARVTIEGKLILADGAEIESAKVTRAEDGDINVNGGHTDLSKSQSANVHINQGTAQVGDRIYTSADNTPIDVSIKDGKITLTGTNVVEAKNGITTATFSGEVTTFADGHKTFSKGTEYAPYLDGKRSKKYNVDGLTEYHTTAGCDGSRNCIQDVDGNVRVVAKDNNKINIEQYDNSITSLKIDQIDDNSLVTFNDKENVELEFSKGPLIVRGDINALSLNVESTFINNNGETHTFRINDGLILQCSEPCKVSGDVAYHKKRFNQLKENILKAASDRTKTLADGTKLFFKGNKVLAIDSEGNQVLIDENGNVYSISDDKRLIKIEESRMSRTFSQEFLDEYNQIKQKLAAPSSITQVSNDDVNRRLAEQINYADISFKDDTKVQDAFKQTIGSKEYQIVRTDKGDVIITQKDQKYAFIFDTDSGKWKYLDQQRGELVYSDLRISELTADERSIVEGAKNYNVPNFQGYTLDTEKDLAPERSIAKHEIKDQTGRVVGYYVYDHRLQEAPYLQVGDKKIEIDSRVSAKQIEQYFKTTSPDRKLEIDDIISDFYYSGANSRDYLRDGSTAYQRDDQTIIVGKDGKQYYIDDNGNAFEISPSGQLKQVHDVGAITNNDVASFVQEQKQKLTPPSTITSVSHKEVSRRIGRQINGELAFSEGTAIQEAFKQTIGNKNYQVARTNKGDISITEEGQDYALIYDTDSKKWYSYETVRGKKEFRELDTGSLSQNERSIIREAENYRAPNFQGYTLDTEKDLAPERSIAKHEIKDQTGRVVGYYVYGHGLQEAPYLQVGDKKIEIDSRVSAKQIEQYFKTTK